jgi:hypothetical protein
MNLKAKKKKIIKIIKIKKKKFKRINWLIKKVINLKKFEIIIFREIL